MKRQYEVDELNPLPTFDDYFETMDLTTKQRESRIALAETFLEMFLFIFAFATRVKDLSQIEAKLKAEYIKALPPKYKINGAIKDPYMKDYLNIVVASIAGTTYNGVKHDRSWDISYDRAFDLATNEANGIENYGDFAEAKTLGFTKKTWVTEGDERVRLSHAMLDGSTILIDDLFLVGSSYMRFPKDIMFNPSTNDIAGCRCTIIYK